VGVLQEVTEFIHSLIPARTEAIVGGFTGGTGMIVTFIFGEWNNALQALAMFILLDYITGVMAAYMRPRAKLSSKKGLRGIIKKLALITAVAFAHGLDIATGQTVFCTVATYSLLGNEGLSIVENLSYCGVPIPASVRDKLESLSKEKEAKSHGN
jgi:toxin secretion/phage lysis holin